MKQQQQQQQKPKKQKNSDIQILRAVAIAAVLGFHLCPSIVPQGYLGVDIFFVISGYLMTSILDEKELSLQTSFRFYERRLRRLLPAYLLVILLTLAVTSLFLIGTDYEFLKYDTLWAMFFGTNFQSMFEKETYFKLVSDYKFLLHTWSLSVEFQYYFIAPFILIPLAEAGNPLIPTACLSCASFMFQLLIPYPTLSFGLVLSRVWQFLMGTVIFHIQKNQTEQHLYTQLPEEVSLMSGDNENDDIETGKSEDALKGSDLPSSSFNFWNPKIFVFVAIIAICFMQQLSEHLIYSTFMRLVAIVLSGLAIYYGKESKPTGQLAWLQKIGIYIGNISYSLYLLHWPIIIFAKYQTWFDESNILPIFGVIMALSIIQYHCYEKVFLTQPSKVIFSLVTLIYICLIILLIEPQGFGFAKFEHPGVAGNQKIAHECNHLIMDTDCNWDPALMEVMNYKKPTKAAAYYCSYEGSGNLTIFFTGNSFALRQLAGIKKALHKIYKKLYFVARPACLTFESFNVGYGGYWQCDEVMNKTVEFLKKVKPDILLITEKVSDNGKFRGGFESIDDAYNDTTTQGVAEYFELWSPYVKRIYHIEPHPTLYIQPATTMAKELAQGKSLTRHALTLPRIRGQVDPGWWRIKAAMQDCVKCAPIEMNEDFMEDGLYYYYDRKTKLSLFCDNAHFSPVGAAKMVPFLKKFFHEAIKEL